MIVVFGGIKGGVGKTTLSVNTAIIRATAGHSVLLVDADEQGSASDFTSARNETLQDKARTDYVCIKLHGKAVRTELLKLADKYDDIIIDVGGRDTAGQRAALSLADMYIIPLLPASYDVWTLDKVSTLIEEAAPFNPTLVAQCVINRGDAKGEDNQQAARIAEETPHISLIPVVIGNRKAFRTGAAQGLAVTELKPADRKACEEITAFYKHLYTKKL